MHQPFALTTLPGKIWHGRQASPSLPCTNAQLAQFWSAAELARLAGSTVLASCVYFTTALVLLVQRQETYQVVFAIAAAIIIGREITISALREWMSEVGERALVSVSWVGKLKTGFQMTAIGFLLYHENMGLIPTALIGEILLYTAAALTLWSMWSYLQSAWPVISDNKHHMAEEKAPADTHD